MKIECRAISAMLVALLLANVLAGCNEKAISLAKYRVEHDSIGLKKIPLRESGVTVASYPIRSVFSQIPLSYYWSVQHTARELVGDKDASWYCQVRFNHLDYYLVRYDFNFPWFGPWHRDNIDVVKKQTKEMVAKLPIFAGDVYDAFELTMNGTPYLIFYTNFGNTRKHNSSRLYVIDTGFKIVYEECLTGAKDFGFATHPEYGNCIVVRTRNEWKIGPATWEEINGDWLYYLPKK